MIFIIHLLKHLKEGRQFMLTRDDSLERYDLNIKNVEFETTWIEIKNKKRKNIVCGSVYRHPHNNCDDFFQYLETCLMNIAKENKEVYICGDFNFDLLKVDTDHITQHFFNLLCSYGFLPHILQPRVTEHTATVIDNIFSNNLQDDILSGNVLLILITLLKWYLLIENKLTLKISICIGEIIQSCQVIVLARMFLSKIGVILMTM